MKVLLSAIPESGLTWSEDEPSEILDFQGEILRAEGPIHCHFEAQLLDDTLIVRGAWRVPLKLECSRCGVFFSTSVEDSSFLRDYVVTPETFFVDISEDLREEVVLHVPHFPVCGTECKGRCLQYGKDLNAGACDCSKQPAGSPAWSALDAVHLN